MKTVITRLREGFFNALRPPPKLSLSEWADQYAYLSAESAAEPGKWKSLPYQKGIMDACTDPKIEQISVCKSARVGYTKILLHIIGYHIHQNPTTIMLVQPTLEDAQNFSKEEISPMLRDTPVLRGLVSEAKAKDGSNTILTKQFPGGVLGLVGANSPRGFRRTSRQIILFDETDGYPVSAGSEGDQIKLGIRRSEYYWNRKIVAGSTPTVAGASRIERLYESSDQRRYFVPCPHCGEYQYLKWKNLQWPESKPKEAFFACEVNGCVIEHKDKRSMVEKGEWRPTAEGNGKHAGFHIWAAYSYSPNASWGNLAEEFLEAKKDAESLKTFINTVVGEVWEEEYSAKVSEDELAARAEFYESGTAPEGVLLVTSGIDVQDNRLSVTRMGWGRDEEAWIIDRQEIFGDPARPEIWKQLDEYLDQPVPHETAAPLKVRAAAIDSGGHFTHQVYSYTRERRLKDIIAIKGASTRGKPAISKPSKVDFNYKGQTFKRGAQVYSVGTDTLKSLIFGRLKHNQPGPGYIHFHADLGPDYYQQLTAEKQMIRYVRGFVVKDWVKRPGARNEALDEMVYNFSALNYLLNQYNRKTFWDQFERNLKPKPDATAKASPQTPRQNSAPQQKIRAGKRNFVTGW
jgi:phage terminase large subunit GpA-like protein